MRNLHKLRKSSQLLFDRAGEVCGVRLGHRIDLLVCMNHALWQFRGTCLGFGCGFWIRDCLKTEGENKLLLRLLLLIWDWGCGARGRRYKNKWPLLNVVASWASVNARTSPILVMYTYTETSSSSSLVPAFTYVQATCMHTCASYTCTVACPADIRGSLP